MRSRLRKIQLIHLFNLLQFQRHSGVLEAAFEWVSWLRGMAFQTSALRNLEQLDSCDRNVSDSVSKDPMSRRH